MNILATMKYKILAFVLAFAALASCVDDLEPLADNNEIPQIFTDGYALNFVVTLDNMGGTRADMVSNYSETRLTELENYIDPEKFRVLFFDRQDRFLFESKSRWVKQLQSESNELGGSKWLVSVPLYDVGNDADYHWVWDSIRSVLTGEDMAEDIKHKDNPDLDADYKFSYSNAIIEKVEKGELDFAFKIAILANHPTTEWNMGINVRKGGADITDGSGNPVAKITEGGWAIKNGPQWNVENTRFGTGEKKGVFDLHHCQDDPIYRGKNYIDTWVESPIAGEDYEEIDGTDGETYHVKKLDIYNFVGTPEGSDALLCGPTSTWVDWSGNDKTNKYSVKLKDGVTASYRKFTPLSTDHPIPMYGIQTFPAIDNWVKGTPFNLSYITIDQEASYELKSISLLRSVVRLELILPFEPEWVLMWYPNIYARCEPMDVWTPTDVLWEGEEHKGKDHVADNDNDPCEWFNIRKYGPISRDVDAKNNTKGASISTYQQRLLWFYGSWFDYMPDGEKRAWTFANNKFGSETISPEGLSQKNFDKIINEQSDGNKYVANDFNKKSYPRIFNSCIQRNNTVYCGNDLIYHTTEGGVRKTHYVVYTGERNINDPADISTLGLNSSGKPTVCYWMFKKGSTVYSIALADYEDWQSSGGDKNEWQPFCTANVADLSGLTNSMGNSSSSPHSNFEEAVQRGEAKPWPLMRNHIYRTEVGYIEGTAPKPPVEAPIVWDFTKLSESTITALSESSYWTATMDGTHNKGWGNTTSYNVSAENELRVNSTSVVEEAKGLKFKNGNTSINRFNLEYDLFEAAYSDITDTYITAAQKALGKYYLRLEGSGSDTSSENGSTFTFPRLPIDSYLTIVSKLPVKGSPLTDRFIECTQGGDGLEFVQSNAEKISGGKYYVYGEGVSDEKGPEYRYIFTWKVKDNASLVTFRVGSNKGLAFEKFRVTETNPWKNEEYDDYDDDSWIVGRGSNGARASTRADNADQPYMMLKTDVRYSKSLRLDQPRTVK